jgi:acyl-CoA synthetase (NDP forming)
MAEFTDTLELFSARRRSHGGGVATVHDSGAERALLADLAHDLEVPFAELADDTLAGIGAMLDEGLVPANPLDVWGTGADTRTLFGDCLRAMADDPGVGVTALAVDMVTEYDGDTAYVDAVLDVASSTEAPLAVLASVPSAIDAPTAQRLRGNGIPVLEGYRSGLSAMGHLARWPLPVGSPMPTAGKVRSIPGDPFQLLAAYGIPIVETRTAHSIAVAIAAAEAIGYPVVLKTISAQHKSDIGGVALGLADDEELTSAYALMTRTLGPLVTVQPMIAGGIEVSVGFVRDDAFGPLLVVAAGGTLVELLADRVVACPPVSHAGALALLDRLRIRPLLAGWRGASAVDIEALADVIVAFSRMAVEVSDVVDAVEANPVIASAHGVVAVDALVQMRRAES